MENYWKSTAYINKRVYNIIWQSDRKFEKQANKLKQPI
jgi:hypothetical protein